MMSADMYGSHKDTMTPSAIVPIETPQEAIDELEFCVTKLGLKTITINGSVTRQPTKDEPRRIIPLALDGEYDYDPFWKRCAELGVSIACHGGSSGSDRHASRVNYTFNHIGTFATHGEFFCRSLFFGGVSRRFPTLNFAFLEGGVGWACSLYNSIFEHWEKRNKQCMAEFLDPRRLDVELLIEMSKKYPNPHVTPERVAEEFSEMRAKLAKDSPVPDDFAACRIERGEDIRDLFTKTFFFGCEADDRMAAVAFDDRLHHEGAKFKAIFSSDIGHWDVLNALGVLNEAYAMREDGVLSEDDFADFTFAHSVRLHGGMNPDFFKGTVIEDAANKVLAADKKAE
jgi:predicted TIM-barrel fold metal-dependent hydrolase